MVKVSPEVEVKLLKWWEKYIPPGADQGGQKGLQVGGTSSAKVLRQERT